jgi:hypothetical protein
VKLLSRRARLMADHVSYAHATTCGRIAATGTEQLCETLSLGPRPPRVCPLNTRLLGLGWLPTRLALSWLGRIQKMDFLIGVVLGVVLGYGGLDSCRGPGPDMRPKLCQCLPAAQTGIVVPKMLATSVQQAARRSAVRLIIGLSLNTPAVCFSYRPDGTVTAACHYALALIGRGPGEARRSLLRLTDGHRLRCVARSVSYAETGSLGDLPRL